MKIYQYIRFNNGSIHTVRIVEFTKEKADKRLKDYIKQYFSKYEEYALDEVIDISNLKVGIME
jgi:hypothetical protein